MVRIDISYEGDLRCRATHGPSRTVLQTDAPTDNHGRGESFSPTDLMATALGTCMATVMGIAARKRSIDLSGMHVTVDKEMTKDGPRRVARLPAKIVVPDGANAIPADARKALEEIAESCPVRLSLLAAIDVPLEFDWSAKT